MFGRHQTSKRSNLLLVFLRFFLSLLMFGVLGFGLYLAYVQFAGIDPLKLDPKALVLSLAKSDQAQRLVDKVFGEKSIIPSGNSFEPQYKNPLFSFMLVADSHNENNYLAQALNQEKSTNPNLAFVIGLGDYTQVGTVEELRSAKKEFDANSLRYFVIPGDHDIWDARDKQLDPQTNFKEVFGAPYQTFDFKDVKFILLDNSDNYKGLSDEQMRWLQIELENTRIAPNQPKAILVFLQTPLSHPSSDHVMGRVEQSLKHQARNLSALFKGYGVRMVFAGNIHYFTQYQDPETGLNMLTVGAIASQRNAQAPRFAVVHVYEDGNVGVEDVEIK